MENKGIKIVLPNGDRNSYTQTEYWHKASDHCPACGSNKEFYRDGDYDAETNEDDWLCGNCYTAGSGLEYQDIAIGGENFYRIEHILNPELEMPKENPTPIPEWVKEMQKTVYENVTRELEALVRLKVGKGGTVQFKKYEPLPATDEKLEIYTMAEEDYGKHPNRGCISMYDILTKRDPEETEVTKLFREEINGRIVIDGLDCSFLEMVGDPWCFFIRWNNVNEPLLYFRALGLKEYIGLYLRDYRYVDYHDMPMIILDIITKPSNEEKRNGI